MYLAITYLQPQFIEPLIEQLEQVTRHLALSLSPIIIPYPPLTPGLRQSQVARSPRRHRVRPEHDLLQPLQHTTLRSPTATARLQVPLRRAVRSAHRRLRHTLRLLPVRLHPGQQRRSRKHTLPLSSSLHLSLSLFAK